MQKRVQRLSYFMDVNKVSLKFGGITIYFLNLQISNILFFSYIFHIWTWIIFVHFCSTYHTHDIKMLLGTKIYSCVKLRWIFFQEWSGSDRTSKHANKQMGSALAFGDLHASLLNVTHTFGLWNPSAKHVSTTTTRTTACALLIPNC